MYVPDSNEMSKAFFKPLTSTMTKFNLYRIEVMVKKKRFDALICDKPLEF